MAIPSVVVGGGNNSDAVNVFQITFSEATSDAPVLEAWDDYTFTTTAHEIFAGTAGNGSRSMLGGVATTDGAPSSDWMPADATGGAQTINRLLGSTNTVALDDGAILAAGTVTFNLNWTIPSDATIPSDLAAILVVRFSYAGSAPILTWAYNEGTEGSPSWTTITPGVAGNKIKPADAGSTQSTVVLHRPVSGVQDCGELWVVTS